MWRKKKKGIALREANARINETDEVAVWKRHEMEDVHFQPEATFNFRIVRGGVAAAAPLTQLSRLMTEVQSYWSRSALAEMFWGWPALATSSAAPVLRQRGLQREKKELNIP